MSSYFMSHDMTNAMVIDYGWLNWFSVAHPDLGGCTLLTLQKAIQLTQRWFPRAGNWDSCPEGADCHCCVLREASTRVARGPERGVSTEIEEERPKKGDVEPLIWEAGAGEGGTGAEIGTFGKVLAKRGRVAEVKTVGLLLQLASLVYRLNSAGIVIVFSAIVFPFEIIFNSSHINSEETSFRDKFAQNHLKNINLFWQQQKSVNERGCNHNISSCGCWDHNLDLEKFSQIWLQSILTAADISGREGPQLVSQWDKLNEILPRTCRQFLIIVKVTSWRVGRVGVLSFLHQALPSLLYYFSLSALLAAYPYII